MFGRSLGWVVRLLFCRRYRWRLEHRAADGTAKVWIEIWDRENIPDVEEQVAKLLAEGFVIVEEPVL